MLQESLHAKVGQSRSEEYRGQLSLAHQLLIELRAGAVQKLDVIHELFFLTRIQDAVNLWIVDGQIQLLTFLGSLFSVGEQQHLLGVPVIDALECLTGADGPVYRAGGNTKLILDIVQQFKDIHRFPVHLIDKGKNGDMAHGADLEKLPGLSLHALTAVNNHNCGIRSHQGTVGVLGEVLMSRSIQNVDTIAVVIKL